MTRIVVLVHARDRDTERWPHRIWALRDLWRARGCEVEFQIGVPAEPTDAIVINHVDRTWLPPEYGDYFDRCPRVVNGAVRDISKSIVSRALVRPGDEYTGPVIVKTDANFGGGLELNGSQSPGLLARIWSRFRRPTLATARSLDPTAYPIFAAVDDVRPGVFDNPALVVERFLPDRENELYAVHNYYFFGDQAVCFRRTCPHPIVKGMGTVEFVETSVHDTIVAERERLGFDTGKFDYVVHAGEAWLLDANHTPTWGYAGGGQVDQERICALLAKGIDRWIEQ